MKCGSEAALACNKVGPAFENLRRQTCGHSSRLAGERTSRVKTAGRIMAGDNFDRANRLRSHCLRCIKRILGAGSARLDLRHVELAREAVLLLYIREF